MLYQVEGSKYADLLKTPLTDLKFTNTGVECTMKLCIAVQEWLHGM